MHSTRFYNDFLISNNIFKMYSRYSVLHWPRWAGSCNHSRGLQNRCSWHVQGFYLGSFHSPFSHQMNSMDQLVSWLFFSGLVKTLKDVIYPNFPAVICKSLLCFQLCRVWQWFDSVLWHPFSAIHGLDELPSVCRQCRSFGKLSQNPFQLCVRKFLNSFSACGISWKNGWIFKLKNVCSVWRQWMKGFMVCPWYKISRELRFF